MNLLKQLLTCASALLLLGTAYGQTINTFPFVEDFETQLTGPTGCGPLYTFTGNTWQNGDDPALALPMSATHQVDWTVDAGGTGSATTGPSVDNTTSTAAGNYIYAETSCSGTGFPNVSFELISPYFDFTATTAPQLEFWYHDLGTEIGMLYIDAVVGANGTWTSLDSIAGVNTDVWKFSSTSLGAYNTLDSVRLRLRYVSGIGFYGDLALDDIAVINIIPIDAGITAIDNPVNPVIVGVNNIDVTLQSFGADTLTTATIEWSVDGVVQTPFAWTGNLGYYQADPALNIGTYNFPAGLFTLKAWTSMPNGSADPNNVNDTTEVMLCTPLNGAYTVGGAGADFADMVTLGDMLSSCGVNAPVTVTVNPGVYVGRVILDHVPGTSATNTITIDGVDTSFVTMTANAFSNIYFDGTDYTTIRNITLENSGTTDAYGVQFRDTSEYNTLDYLRIILPETTGLADVVGVSASNLETSSFTEGQNAIQTTVSNCHISGGEKGIHFEGQNALRTVGNSFINNLIENVEDYGFYMDDQDEISIIGNTVRNITANTGDGIYCFDLMMFDISYNSVHNVPDYGMYISDGNFDAVATTRGRISNNMVSSSTDFAAYFDDFQDADIFNNTFNGSPGLYMNDFVNLDIRNNIFASDGDYAFETLDATTLTANTINYNAYWTPAGSALFVKDGTGIHTDLPTWQAAVPVHNTSSIEADPVFLDGLDDLHVLSPNVNDLGDNTVSVADDIDGDIRPMGPIVDMGADEFTPNPNNLALISYILPSGCGDSTAPIYMVVQSFGTDTVFTFDATANISGDNTATLNYTYNDTISFGNVDTVLIGIVNTYWGEDFIVDGWVTLLGDTINYNDSLADAWYNIPYQPIGYGGFACGDSSAWITAEPINGGLYNWFASSDQVNDTIPIATADSLLVPNVTTQGTYYLQYADGADSLNTPLNQNNGAGGVMFDVVALNPVVVTALSIDLDPGVGDFAIYYRTGTWVGNDLNQNNDWILLGQTTALNSTGGNTLIPISFAVSMPAGQTYAFCVQELTAGNIVNYTNGTVVGNVWAANIDMQVLEGCGKATGPAFNGSTFQPRNFNGTVHYGGEACSNIRVPVTATLGQLADPSYTAAATSNVVDFTSSGAAQNTAYAWDFGDGSALDTNANTQHTFTTDSTYVICLTATSECGDSTWCDTMTICETMAPAFTYVQTGNGYSVDFTDNTSGTPTSWSWDFGDGNTSTLQNPSHTYASTDSTYTATLTVTNFCGETETTTQTIGVSNLYEAFIFSEMSIYPNPSSGEFTIQYSGEGSESSMTVVDLQGRMIYSELIGVNGAWSTVVDLRAQPNGVYFLHVLIDGTPYEYKLLKAK